MRAIDRRSIQHFDWFLLGLILVLVGLGIANLYSATFAGARDGMAPEFRRQLLALAVASIAFLVCAFADYRKLERFATPIFLGTLILLASTLVLAPVVRGNRSWLIYGPFSLQPAELAKIGLVIAMARYLHHHPPTEGSRVRDLVGPGVIAVLPVGLIILQRDLGVAVLTALIAATYLPFLRIPAKVWLVIGAAGAAGLTGLWHFALKAYQRDRILDFLDPTRDPLSSGYQAMQSKIAVGSGGLFGRGFLEGTQTQLQFLPTQHSDFVFSVLGEEWGFIGATTVIVLYSGLLLWGLVVARNAKDTFGAMLAVGIVGVLFWPAAMNIAMVLGLAPVIGVPLPLFSYGGSALLAALIGLGLMLNISMRRYIF